MDLLTIINFCVQLSKRDIDNYKPGKSVCSFQLSATLSDANWSGQVPKRSYLATLNGAKAPKDRMVIELDSIIEPQHQGVSYVCEFPVVSTFLVTLVNL